MAENLKIVSLNVRGIRAKDKRLKLFRWFIDVHRADIVLLQETHSSPHDEISWTDEWAGDIYFSHGAQNARGVCIMINIGHTCHNVVADNSGRYIMIDTTVSDRRMTNMNVYAPNMDEPNFF